VRGELDWIVMKCLEKDRARRYDSASSLAIEIQHYLADEPVSAAAPSRIYLVRKFVRRNKVAVTAAAALLVVLIAGITGTTLGMIGQAHQRAVAEQHRVVAEQQRGEAQTQTQEARRQAAIAAAVSTFQSD